MDTASLVNEGSTLVRLLDETSIKPAAAMWVSNSEDGFWRLWLVPAAPRTDKLEFFRILADVFSKNRDVLPSLDIGDIVLKERDHPAIKGLKSFFRMEGLGSARFSGNRLNGFYLPDGIVLRMAA